MTVRQHGQHVAPDRGEGIRVVDRPRAAHLDQLLHGPLHLMLRMGHVAARAQHDIPVAIGSPSATSASAAARPLCMVSVAASIAAAASATVICTNSLSAIARHTARYAARAGSSSATRQRAVAQRDRDRRQRVVHHQPARRAHQRIVRVHGAPGGVPASSSLSSTQRCSGTNTSRSRSERLPVPASPSTCQSSMISMSVNGTSR